MFSGRATNRDDPLVIGAAKILQRFVLYLPQLVARPSMSEQTHRPRLNELLTKARNNVIENTRNVTGWDISEYRPEDLQIIDRLLGERFRDAVRREQRRYESAVFGFGTYLGEVLVRRLGGRWHFPTRFQALIGSLSLDPFKGERYFYVLLDDRRVDVFRAARNAIEKTSGIFSLYDFYENCAHSASETGSTLPK